MSDATFTRREVCKLLPGAIVGGALASARTAAAAEPAFRLRYILGSCMYGTTKLAEILPEVRTTGAEHIDIWPKRHGDQREQIEAMGHERFAALLERHHVKLGMLTHYDLGPFRLADEMRVAGRYGARILIAGSGGPKGLAGAALKTAVQRFAEKMKPHVETAARHNVVIGIENHGNALLDSFDSLRWFAEAAPSPHIGIALAPYHLPQDADALAALIRDLGSQLVHFYAWQHGHGCTTKLPKEEELLQMPGRGELDFRPIVAALAHIRYRGWAEVFMHPVPRGIPILPTTANVTAEINRARGYLQTCVPKSKA